MSKLPSDHGLYSPTLEHDSCGVGFVVNIKGVRSHGIVENALTILKNLLHRGACGCETNTGDGVGILIQKPDRFFQRVCSDAGFGLPASPDYGAGLVFLPVDVAQAQRCEEEFSRIIAEEGQSLLGWRTLCVDDSMLGATAKRCRPAIRQVFIGRQTGLDVPAFERKLYVIRKRIEHVVLHSDMPDRHDFHICSLSGRTFVYKGMLTGTQIEPMFPELLEADMESALALVHQRFSTNTLPSWRLAQPFRFVAHNGEINTVCGNRHWMRTREAICQSELFGEDMQKLFPIVFPDNSDSATFDNVLEFLHMTGRPLPHAIMMMIPEAWFGHETMDDKCRAFYEYHACLMEPWDGPASIAFTDGELIGAVLDRNGLRPSRYYVTRDDMVIMASEVGVLEVAPEDVKCKERLHPGRIFMVDTVQGRIIDDSEIKQRFIGAKDWRRWLDENLLPIDRLPVPRQIHGTEPETLRQRQIAFGYTQEVLRVILAPMVAKGVEPIGSMGMDTALAVLSRRSRMLYDYFKQLFAQVTNPPLDGIREKLVTQVSVTIGPERNLLYAEPESCRRIRLDFPILDNRELAMLRDMDMPGFKAKLLPILFPARQGGMQAALDSLFEAADAAITAGHTYLILSDRGVGKDQAAIPALLAVSGLHHHLIRQRTRTRVGLVLESAEPCEVHHFATLIGYGLGAVNPYLAFESIDDLIGRGLLEGCNYQQAVSNYVQAVNKGLIKVMSKMGISTVQSYCGAQIFEAIGLHRSVIDRYFTGTVSRIGGIDIEGIERETLVRHEKAFAEQSAPAELESGGEYQWRRDGEYHLFNPHTVFKLQHATRSGQYGIFKEYTALVDEQSENMATLRGLFEFAQTREAIPLDQVEPIENIMRRFSTGAMSYGSISRQAHETLAIAMNRIGGKSNTGEGGEDAQRYVPDENGDLRRSAIKQVASGRFGVTSEYLTNADDIQIKMAQGAKPGEGGQLPGTKVYPWIAKVRHSTAGVGLISPPPHHDIYSIEDLAQLIHDLKNANPEARVHVKLVAEAGVGTVAAGVAKAHADVVLISGYDGGTGASPLSSLKHAGLPWELGLAETQQVLVRNKLRDRIVVQTDGQLKTGRDVVIAALLGAEEYGFATAPLVVMGCIMMRVCHLNTCPVGVATQNPELVKKFSGQPEFVENFFRYIAEEVREYMARLGFRCMDEMIGQADSLCTRNAITYWKEKGLDFSAILQPMEAEPGVGVYCQREQDHGLEQSLDMTTILPLCEDALEKAEPVDIILPIANTDRTVGTILGHHVTRRYGGEGLPDDTINIHFNGSAGMSFGAFIPRGISLTLEGDANDYIGKGLSGGKIIVCPPRHALFTPEENILIGNVALYGATRGEAYFRGVAGERFCVRNSGAHAVVEGVGDHGCEYMTGGRVVILSRPGRNFAAGMSGGIAYVLDPDGSFPVHCNQEMVGLEPVSADEDVELLKSMLQRHLTYTNSSVAKRLLDNWPAALDQFVKVMPHDYRRVLEAVQTARARGISEEEAMMEAAHG